MKVLQVVTKSEHGGAQTHVWQLSRCLEKAGHVVHITAFPGGWLEKRAREGGTPFHPNSALSNSLDPFRGLSAGRRIAGLVREIRPDIVHCHSSAAGFWARLMIRGSTPTVFTAHGWGFMPGTPALRRIALMLAERLVSRFTARYICVSERDARLAERYGIASSVRITVIHNGVEHGVDHAPRSRPGTVIKAIFVGRLAKPKQPEQLLDALCDLPPQLRDAYELQIVGDGPLLPALQARLRGTSARVTLAGALERDKVMEALARSDVFVLPSWYEGFPMSILEAMSMGLAVVASDVGGVREAVGPECGILVPRGSQAALRQALARLAEDPAAIARLGTAGRERVRREFSLAAMCDRTMAVYEGVRAA